MILTPASGVIPGTIRWLWEEHIQCQSLNTAGTAQDEWAAALGGADDLLWWSSDLVDSLLPAQVVNAGTLSQCHNRATVFLPGSKRATTPPPPTTPGSSHSLELSESGFVACSF